MSPPASIIGELLRSYFPGREQLEQAPSVMGCSNLWLSHALDGSCSQDVLRRPKKRATFRGEPFGSRDSKESDKAGRNTEQPFDTVAVLREPCSRSEFPSRSSCMKIAFIHGARVVANLTSLPDNTAMEPSIGASRFRQLERVGRSLAAHRQADRHARLQSEPTRCGKSSRHYVNSFSG